MPVLNRLIDCINTKFQSEGLHTLTILELESLEAIIESQNLDTIAWKIGTSRICRILEVLAEFNRVERNNRTKILK